MPGLYRTVGDLEHVERAVGAPILRSDWSSLDNQTLEPFIYVPDDASGDGPLRSLQRVFARRSVWPYGTLHATCGVQSYDDLTPSRPLKIVSIARKRDTMRVLGVGTMAGVESPLGLALDVFDPIEITFQLVGRQARGVDACERPKILLADFQVGLTLSLHPPPRDVDHAPLCVGTSRDILIWRRGFPSELGDRAALERLPTWVYGRAMDYLKIDFTRDDRIKAIFGEVSGFCGKTGLRM